MYISISFNSHEIKDFSTVSHVQTACDDSCLIFVTTMNCCLTNCLADQAVEHSAIFKTLLGINL